MTASVAPSRGRHRSPAADAAILSAALEVLGESGYEGMTMCGVIERAGVSSATLYRRWSTKSELVAAAVAAVVPATVDIDTGSLEGDVGAFLQHYAKSVGKLPIGVSDALLTESRHDPGLADALREKFVTPKIRTLRAILARAAARGEVRSGLNPETALSLVAGPIHYHGVVRRHPLTPSFVAQAASHAVAGLAAR